MFSDLASVREHLATRIKAHLPSDWITVTKLEADRKTVKPVLYFEYTEVSSSVNGAPLGRGQVACSITLTIAAPGDDEDAADSYILPLTAAFQDSDDIYWDTATKTRIGTATGALGWRIPLTLLVDAEPAIQTPEV